MISESKCNSPPKTNNEGKSLSEIIERYPHLIKAYLSYFLSVAKKNNDVILLNYLFSIRSIGNSKTFDDFFFQCVQLSKRAMISFCLMKGQYVNIQNASGETALHIAATNNDYETIIFLQSYGADKYIKNNKGLTPYDYALDQGCKRVIEALKAFKSYSMEMTESPNKISNRRCHTSRMCDVPPNQLQIDKFLMGNTKKSQMDILLSQRSEEYPPEIMIDNKESLSKMMSNEEEFPIEYIKTNINVISNHRYCNDNINKTNEEIIDINKYTGLLIDDTNIINKEKDDPLLTDINIEQNNNESEAKISYPNQKQITVPCEKDKSQKDLRKTLHLELDDNDHLLSSPYDIEIPKEHLSGSFDNIIPKISQMSTEKKTTSKTMSINNINSHNQSCGDVLMFLSEIQLEEYTNLLIKNGFDDINLIIEQTRKSIAMTNENLYDAGIRIAGDRAKILIHLEEKAGLYDFSFNRENVYYKYNRLLNSMYRSDRHIQKLYRILSSIKMEKYLNNFISSGYVTFDLIIMQMLSRQPMNEHSLENDIKIDKIGYRARLLSKFKEEAQNYYLAKGRNKNILIDSQNNSSDFCNCVIY